MDISDFQMGEIIQNTKNVHIADKTICIEKKLFLPSYFYPEIEKCSICGNKKYSLYTRGGGPSFCWSCKARKYIDMIRAKKKIDRIKDEFVRDYVAFIDEVFDFHIYIEMFDAACKGGKIIIEE